MRRLGLRFIVLLALVAVLVPLIAACGSEPASAPVPTVPPPPTAPPPPMANKLILYGDLTSFAGKGVPDSCTLKSRYHPGENVGFRMTAVDPLTGKVVDTAELVVHITFGGKTVDVPMRYRGTGQNPHPGMWTGKWVVPKDAPAGVVQYTVTGKDATGRTGEFKPFQVEASELTIVQ